MTGALEEMRSREELSSELHRCQAELSRCQAELRAAKRAASAGGGGAGAASSSEYLDPVLGGGGGEVEAYEDEASLRTALLERDQRLLELGFSLEAHEITISQLQARLRDQAAYVSTLQGGSGAAAHATPDRAPCQVAACRWA